MTAKPIISLFISTPTDEDLVPGTPAALFRPALALIAYGDGGESWERGMRAFTEGMINCINVTLAKDNIWVLVDRAVAIGLKAAGDGRPDFAQAFAKAWAEYERQAAGPVGDPIPASDVRGPVPVPLVSAQVPASAQAPAPQAGRPAKGAKQILAELFGRTNKPKKQQS